MEMVPPSQVLINQVTTVSNEDEATERLEERENEDERIGKESDYSLPGDRGVGDRHPIAK